MREGWEVKKLGEVYDVRDGTHNSPKYQDKGYPLITSKNLKEGMITFDKIKYISEDDYKNINKRSKVDKGDILFAMIGTIGNPTIVTNEPNYAIKNVALFKLKNHQNSKFLKYFLETPFTINKMQNEARGTTQKFVGLRYLREFPIIIPPLEEQQQIVAILDDAFAAIEQAQANIEKNIENAKELFQSKLNEIFSQKGEGWEERSLGDLSLLKSGGTPLTSNPSYWANEGIAWYSSGELNDTYTQEPERHITNLGLKNSNAKVFPKGSLLIGMYDTAALKMSIIDRDATFNQAIVGVEPNSDIDLNFIMLSIQSQKTDILKLRRGVRQKNLNQTKIKAIKIYLPEISIQKDLVSKINKVNLQLNKLEDFYQQKLTNLEDLKKSLLEQAFAGKLTCNEPNPTH